MPSPSFPQLFQSSCVTKTRSDGFTGLERDHQQFHNFAFKVFLTWNYRRNASLHLFKAHCTFISLVKTTHDLFHNRVRRGMALFPIWRHKLICVRLSVCDPRSFRLDPEPNDVEFLFLKPKKGQLWVKRRKKGGMRFRQMQFKLSNTSTYLSLPTISFNVLPVGNRHPAFFGQVHWKWTNEDDLTNSLKSL